MASSLIMRSTLAWSRSPLQVPGCVARLWRAAHSAADSAQPLPPASNVVRKVASPNATWQAPSTPRVAKLASQQFTSMAAADVPVAKMYKLLIQTVVPRPIAFVSTIDLATGKHNLAPYSFFNAISSNPPCLMISATRNPDGSKKDTLLNIEDSGCFVVNVVTHDIAEPMNFCATTFPRGISEFEQSGLTPIASSLVKAPRCAESPVQFECSVYKTVEIGDGSAGSAVVVFGKIEMVHARSDLFDAETWSVSFEKLRALGRIGGFDYALSGEYCTIVRPRSPSSSSKATP